MLRLLGLGALFENKSEEVVGPKGKEMRYVHIDPHLSLAEACPGVVNSLVPCVLVLYGPAAKESP